MEKKVSKPKKEKKPKIIENRGITGIGTDYTIYRLSVTERLLAVTVGGIGGFAASYAYFSNTVLGVIVAVIVALNASPIYSRILLKKRYKELRLQFRDLLESLSNSYTVGMVASRAFRAAQSDMILEHGEKAYIVKELNLLCSSYDNQGIEIKRSLNDFANRSGLEDIRSFAGVFEVSTDLGVNVAKAIRETRDIIGEKIEVEMEIQTMITGTQGQLNVIMVIPFAIAIIMKVMNMGENNALALVIKSVALIIFVFAYWIGKRIVDIKV